MLAKANHLTQQQQRQGSESESGGQLAMPSTVTDNNDSESTSSDVMTADQRPVHNNTSKTKNGPHNNAALNIMVAQKAKPTIASTNLQYTASTHDNKQTLELDFNPKVVIPGTDNNSKPSAAAAANSQNLERNFPVEVMAPDSLNNTPVQSPILTHSTLENQKKLNREKRPKTKNSSTKQRLVRTYSETETTNFSSATGSRVFDDGRHRPYHGFPSTRRVSFNKTNKRPIEENNNKNTTLNASENIDPGAEEQNKSYVHYSTKVAKGIEDEYIPDFNFGNNLLDKWFGDDDEDHEFLQDVKKRKLDLHTDLTPISVPRDHHHHHETVATPNATSEADEYGKLTKIDLNSLESLPENFRTLPFSQRKKILMNIYPNYSYSELTGLIKSYLKTGSTASPFHKLSTKSSSSSMAASYLSNLSTPSQMPQAPQEFDVNKRGAIVMDHQLLGVVGQGAWGVIRECKHVTTNEMRAMKIIYTCNDKVKKIFMNEIYIWSLLEHPNILPLMSFKETQNNIFACTKLNYGGTLYDLIYKWGNVKDQQVSKKEREQRILHFVNQILQPLKYMHNDLAIIHGDLKLENLLVDEHDNLLLCDFGMSKIFAPDSERPKLLREKSAAFFRKNDDFVKILPTTASNSPNDNNYNALNNSHSDDGILSITAFNKLGPSLTSTRLRKPVPDTAAIIPNENNNEESFKIPDKKIGSLPYASPELLTSDTTLSPAQDVWSLGIAIYTMLVGDLPFKHDYEPRLRMMILHGKYDTDTLEAEYGKESKLVQAVMNGCLVKDASERWSIDRLIDELSPVASA